MKLKKFILSTLALCALATTAIADFTGNYSGTWRAGFVNPKPMTLTIAGTRTTGLNQYGFILGTTANDGSFNLINAGSSWVGSFYWNGSELVGDFIVNNNPLIQGHMWLTRT